MGFIGIFRNILAKETTRRAQLPALVKQMREDSVKYRREHMRADSPAVDPSTTIEEFKSAYRNLQICSVISFSYLVGILIYNIKSPSGMLLVTSIVMGIVGLLGHFSFVIRAYRAREVAENWETRHESFAVSVSEVIDAALTDPLALLPALKGLHFSSDKINKK